MTLVPAAAEGLTKRIRANQRGCTSTKLCHFNPMRYRVDLFSRWKSLSHTSLQNAKHIILSFEFMSLSLLHVNITLQTDLNNRIHYS